MKIWIKNTLVVFYLILTACADDQPIKGRIVSVNCEEWLSSEPTTLPVEITDTLAARDVYFLMRLTDTYEKKGFKFELTLIRPDEQLWRDTFDLPASPEENDGFRGVLFGIREVEKQIIENARFDQTGEYQFSLRHLEGHAIKGVSEVGIICKKRNGEK